MIKLDVNLMMFPAHPVSGQGKGNFQSHETVFYQGQQEVFTGAILSTSLSATDTK
jgi:hypothetical protein